MPMTLDVDWKLVVAHFFRMKHVQRSQTLTPLGDETNKTEHRIAVGTWFTGPIIEIWASIGKSSRNHQNDEMLRPSISSQIDGCLKNKPRVGTNPMWVASWLMFCIIVQVGKVKQFGQVQLWKLPEMVWLFTFPKTAVSPRPRAPSPPKLVQDAEFQNWTFQLLVLRLGPSFRTRKTIGLSRLCLW